VIVSPDHGRVTMPPSTDPTWYCRPAARLWRCAAPDPAAAAFHAGLPGFGPTALADLPALASELRVGRVLVKDESGRMGLGAFKVLGASWAIARLLAEAAFPAGAAAGPVSVAVLRAAAARHPVELVTATDGNHGRAVAWTARLLGLPARVFVPDVVSAAAAGAIAGLGATVTVAGASHDEAVAAAAAYASEAGGSGPVGSGTGGSGTGGSGTGGSGTGGSGTGVSGTAGRALVQDTAWPGYEQVPGWIVDGYATLLGEVDRQLAGLGLAGPDLISVPVGVGSLAQAVVARYRSGPAGVPGPAVLSAEPDTAACVLASLRAGAATSVPTGSTVMAGLNCNTVSSIAWPVLAGGLDAAIAVTDPMARQAAADLAALGIASGPSAAAALAGARAALTGPGSERRRADLAVTPSSVVVVLSTEGTWPQEPASPGA
jgi:diaminopropionate ammonia-lyase